MITPRLSLFSPCPCRPVPFLLSVNRNLVDRSVPNYYVRLLLQLAGDKVSGPGLVETALSYSKVKQATRPCVGRFRRASRLLPAWVVDVVNKVP